jgi:UDP-N-acetylglucosamine transferase subunit ALG13
MVKKKKDILNDKYNTARTNEDIEENINNLKYNINETLQQFETPIEDLIMGSNELPKFEMEYEIHDYEKDIELIKIESKQTLECLANLYLDENTMQNKNIYKIIKDDSNQLADLNFSISCAKRALISCMKQLDMGVNDPDMFMAVASFQKEMRDTIKMVYELQKKMKDFYKELKNELNVINSGEKEKIDNLEDDEKLIIISDPKMLNDAIEAKMKNG